MAINIKKSHRGRFTAYKKRTGKTTAEALHSKDPHVRQMANFARNARKWEHELGGLLDTSNLNLGQSFAQINNLPQRNLLSSGLAGTNNPGGKKGGGLGMSFDPIGLGLQALTAIGGSLGANMEMKRSEMYNDAADNMRQVDINTAIKGSGLQSFLQNPLSFGIGGRKKAKLEAEEFNENIAKQQFNKDVGSRFSTMSESPTYTPVARQGGFTVYKGETHEGPNGGILTDEQGNPSGLSNNKPIALTEKNEVARYEPSTGSTYIYSDSLGFAKPATRLVHKYKLDKDNSLYKNDPLLQTAVDRQFDNLMQAQEFAKETKTPSRDALGMFRTGGNLTAWKAKKMLSDNSAQGHPLTARQKRYFGWVAGGRKDDGGELQDNNKTINIPRVENIWGRTIYDPRAFNYNVNPLPPLHIKRNTSYVPKSLGEKILDPILSGLKVRNIKDVDVTKYGTPSSPTDRFLPGYTDGLATMGIPYPIGKGVNNTPKEDWTYTGGKLRNNFSIPKTSTSKGTRSKPVVQGPQRTAEDIMFQRGINPKGIAPYNLEPLPGLQKDIIPQLPTSTTGDTSANPTLNPLGHILSGAGQLADYFAMKNAKPTPVSLSRVGAERISLAKQRLANTRNAESARSINAASTRGLGLNAGSTYANTMAANTGVNRLLGQQNAELLQNEENANAQMQQQANMVNAELAAQEALFNTQQSNAYRAMMAARNPLGNLARTAAGYFADNSAYGQQYDTLRMLAPNAELYNEPNTGFLKKTFGRPKIRFRDKT
jgi:hypothetical protein